MAETNERPLAREMKIGEEEIQRRKRFVEIEDQDLKLVRSMSGMIEKNIDRFVGSFFDFLEKFPEAKNLFTSPTLLAQAKRLKKEHLLAMAEGNIDQAYVNQRIQLGGVYSKAGIDTKVFLGAFHRLMWAIGETLMTEHKSDPLIAFKTFLSFKKIAFFDLGIIMDVIVFDREQMIRRQQEAIRELSTPVLQLRDRLLILPIVGMIDTYRARLLTENLLRAIRANRAKVVVIDITGVAAVDSKVANHLIQTVSASRLMGARVIVTGLSAEIAQTLVTLGAELSKLNTVGDLQGGIEEAERLLGVKVVQDRESLSALE